MSRLDPPTAILDALGIPWKGQNITHAVIELKGGGEFPTATITRQVLGATPNTRKFNWVLTSTDPITFDIDAACKAACQSVRRVIHDAFDKAVTDIAAGFVESRQRLGLPITLEHLELADWPGGKAQWLQFSYIGGNGFFISKGAPA